MIVVAIVVVVVRGGGLGLLSPESRDVEGDKKRVWVAPIPVVVRTTSLLAWVGNTCLVVGREVVDEEDFCLFCELLDEGGSDDVLLLDAGWLAPASLLLLADVPVGSGALCLFFLLLLRFAIVGLDRNTR